MNKNKKNKNGFVFNPHVSIIIPVYNGSNYMREAIDSALAQTYKNIEIIVVNDGSTDDTDEIARSYGDKIRYFRKENGGVATALNLAIKKSKGDYISWLSHDDIYYRNKVEEQILCLKNLDDKNTILYSDWDVINGEGIIVNSVEHRKNHKIDRLNTSLYPVFRGLIHGCTLLLPRGLFQEVGNFDVALKTTQDYDMWFKILRITSIRHIGKKLIKSRVHDKQGSVTDVNHLEEADLLWINMMKNIDEIEVLTFEKNIYSFYQNITIHLKKSPLVRAYSYARKKMKEVGGLISVILPTYNRGYCIERAIKSVLSQSYTKLEIIIIDDGSIDNTDEIVNKFRLDNKIIYHKQVNRGVSSARNNAIKYAKGDYVAFLDSDDFWDKDHLLKHYNFLSNNLEYAMSYNDYIILDLNTKKKSYARGDLHGKCYPDILFIKNNKITTPSVVVSSKIFEKVGYFDENMSMCEDLDLWRRISREHKIGHISDFLTTVEIRRGQFCPKKFMGHRYEFIKKSRAEDHQMPDEVLADLLIEMWRFYFLAGTPLNDILENIIKANADFENIQKKISYKIGDVFVDRVKKQGLINFIFKNPSIGDRKVKFMNMEYLNHQFLVLFFRHKNIVPKKIRIFIKNVIKLK